MTTQPHQTYGELLGTMYKRWVLDCIVDLAYAVSVDFSRRLELYQNVGNATANKLTELQSTYGFDKDFPSREIRATLYRPIFGELASDGLGSGNDGSPFQTTRMAVLAAAADFSENAQPTGFPMLRERIRSAIVPFRNHMVDVKGAALNQTKVRTRAIFDTSVAILTDPTVYSVFGISGVAEGWPGVTDSEGAKLVEKITTQLQGIPSGLITRDRFIRMQRIAEKGANSIHRILETDIENDADRLDELTAQLYAWASDLGLIGGATPQ